MGKYAVIVIILLFLSAAPLLADYSGGTGEPNNPWQIACPNDLLYLGSHPADYNSSFILTADINLAAYTFTTAVIAPIMYDSNGELSGATFTGIFDGDGFVIRNATINLPSSDYVGLFGYVGSGGQIKNLGVEDANITGRVCVGGLVGMNYGRVTNCYATGSVTGTGNGTGGLVGYNYYGSVTDSYATGSVRGQTFVGGLVGDNYYGNVVTNCYATGSVRGMMCVGGLIGENGDIGIVTSSYATGSVSGEIMAVGGFVGSTGGSVTNCYATGSVIGTGEKVGGLAGINSGSVNNCYATGSVSGTGGEVGGLVGISSGSVNNCYATGSVSGESLVGGLIGANGGNVTNCYAAGFVTGTGNGIGGIVGYKCCEGVVTASFWDIETSGQSTSAGGIGKTTAKMKTETTFTDAGWDFVGETINGTEDIWKMRDGYSYSRLNWQPETPDLGGSYGIEFADFAAFASAWQSTPADANWNPPCDLYPDNVIDTLDLQIFTEHWLTGL